LKGAGEDFDRALERARLGKDPQTVWPCLSLGARLFADSDEARAAELADELVAGWKAQHFVNAEVSHWLPDLAIVLEKLGRGDEFLEAARRLRMPTPWHEAAVAYIAGDFATAGDIYEDIRALPDEAYARLRAAEAFVKEGRRAEADAQLEPALAFWRSVGATPYIRQGESLLAESA
jgi:tetratricopeptide (TPR) repeat protein